MGEEESISAEVVAQQRVRLEDPADGHRGRAGLSELDRHGRADVEVLRARGVRVDQQLAGRHPRRSAAGGDVQVDRVRQACRGRPHERGQRAPNLELALVDDGREVTPDRRETAETTDLLKPPLPVTM